MTGVGQLETESGTSSTSSAGRKTALGSVRLESGAEGTERGVGRSWASGIISTGVGLRIARSDDVLEVNVGRRCTISMVMQAVRTGSDAIFRYLKWNRTRSRDVYLWDDGTRKIV